MSRLEDKISFSSDSLGRKTSARDVAGLALQLSNWTRLEKIGIEFTVVVSTYVVLDMFFGLTALTWKTAMSSL